VNQPLWIVLPATALAALAAWEDVRTRRIPNLLTGSALLLAIAVHVVLNGGHGLGSSLLGMLVAGGLLLPGWLAGWMGAGDVKLMAAVGAWLGMPLALTALLATLIAGGLVATVVALQRGVLVRTFRNAFWMSAAVVSGGRPASPGPAVRGIRFPFAVAALAGTVAALVFVT